MLLHSACILHFHLNCRHLHNMADPWATTLSRLECTVCLYQSPPIKEYPRIKVLPSKSTLISRSSHQRVPSYQGPPIKEYPRIKVLPSKSTLVSRSFHQRVKVLPSKGQGSPIKGSRSSHQRVKVLPSKSSSYHRRVHPLKHATHLLLRAETPSRARRLTWARRRR